MPVQQFELFHGIVLTKIVRSERPITLRMIETRPAEAWSSYTLNDEVDLFIKHSTTPKRIARPKGARSYAFVIGGRQLKQMRRSRAHRQVYVALVGGGRDIKGDRMHVCLLMPDEVDELVDFASTRAQSITVRCVPGKSIRVFKEKRERFLVPQNRLDKWEVPGS